MASRDEFKKAREQIRKLTEEFGYADVLYIISDEMEDEVSDFVGKNARRLAELADQTVKLGNKFTDWEVGLFPDRRTR